MKNALKQEKGISLVSLGIAVVILVLLTTILVYNASDSVYIRKLSNLNNDINNLKEKVSEFYNSNGKIPAKVKYNISDVNIKGVLTTKEQQNDFYVIDLQAMENITLNYGRDYDKVKDSTIEINQNEDNDDIYIISSYTYNIFYVEGVIIKENNSETIHYTNYTKPDETEVNLRYVNGVRIPDKYYYIGQDENNDIIISNNKDEEINQQSSTQYKWIKTNKLPEDIILNDLQNLDDLENSINVYNGYFQNNTKNIEYLYIDKDVWSSKYTITKEYTDIKGDTAIIPQGFKISMCPLMNKISEGLVAKDENNNEWVWIEVPKEIFITAKSNVDYENISLDLIEYTKEYRVGIAQNYDFNDEWYDGCGLTQEQYTNLYKTMLTNVYTKGGFWISRYEIGIEGSDMDTSLARTSYSQITESSPKAVSKIDMIPYSNVYCSDAQRLASNMIQAENITSSLLFGVQWDLVCKHIETNANKLGTTKQNRKEAIKIDSTNWGNYNETQFNITSKNAKKYYQSSWSEIKAEKSESMAVILSAGASERNNILNIYDFAGNEWEWTLEKSDSEEMPSVCRGGEYFYTGKERPAVTHAKNYTNRTYNSRGFRVAIY